MPTEYGYVIIAIALFLMAICIGVLIWYSDKIRDLFIKIVKAAFENYFEDMVNEFENGGDSEDEGDRRSRSRGAKRRSRSRNKRPSKRASRSRSRASRQKEKSGRNKSRQQTTSLY